MTEPLCDTCQDRDKKDHETACSGCYDFRMSYVEDPYLIIEKLEEEIKKLKAFSLWEHLNTFRTRRDQQLD